MNRSTKPIQPKLRLQDRRRRLMWVKVAAGSAVVTVVLAAVFYVTRLPEITVAEVRVEGAHLANAESVRTIVAETLQGSYGILIPHANAFFVPKNEIKKSVLASFPEVSEVKISEAGLQTLVISVKERSASAAWCTGADIANISSCYAMDEDGFIFMKIESGEGYVRYFGDVAENPLGSTFLGGDFKVLHAFVGDTVKTVNQAADTVTIEPNNDVNLAFVGGGVLRFVRTEDTRATLDNIASVFAAQSFKTKGNFEYADFRYGNKVYVKFKGE